MPKLREDFIVDLSESYIVSLDALRSKTKSLRVHPLVSATSPSDISSPHRDEEPAVSSAPQGQKYDLIAR
jgi:hypothetical protein